MDGADATRRHTQHSATDNIGGNDKRWKRSVLDTRQEGEPVEPMDNTFDSNPQRGVCGPVRRLRSYGKRDQLLHKPNARPMDNIRIATYNVGTLVGRADQILDWLSKGGINVACLQEI